MAESPNRIIPTPQEVFKWYVSPTSLEEVEEKWRKVIWPQLQEIAEVFKKRNTFQGMKFDFKKSNDVDQLMYQLIYNSGRGIVDPRLGRAEAWFKEHAAGIVKDFQERLGEGELVERPLFLQEDGITLKREGTPEPPIEPHPPPHPSPETSARKHGLPVGSPAQLAKMTREQKAELDRRIEQAAPLELGGLATPAPRTAREYKYKRFMELWPEHEITLKMKEKGNSPTKTFKDFETDLKKLWDIIREKTKKDDIPVKTWGNVTARDLDYLKDMIPNLSTEEVTRWRGERLSPPEWFLRKALLKDVDRIEDEKLREGITDKQKFRADLSDIAFTLYKALKDNLAKEFKKLPVEDRQFDPIRIVEALKTMTQKVGYQEMVDFFHKDRGAFDELLLDSVDQDDFEGLKEVGHGGAGAAAPPPPPELPRDVDEEARFVPLPDSPEDVSLPVGAEEAPVAAEEVQSNNLITAANFSDYTPFIAKNLEKYVPALVKHATYDPFEQANDLGRRIRLADRSSLVDGTSPDEKLGFWVRRIIVA